MAGDDSSDCEDFGHEWTSADEYYLGTHVRSWQYCEHCGDEREDIWNT